MGCPRVVTGCWLVLLLLSWGCGGDESAAPPEKDAGASDCAEGERLVEGKGCLGAGVQDNGCAAGELGLDDGTCRPAGIPPELCAEGFEADGKMGCNAILPAGPCARGLMAVPGETVCREVAPCGSGTWGDIPVDATTQHVDAAYPGADSDGTMAKPWKSVQPAVDAAEPGAIVAVAMGSYQEAVLIQGKPVRLWGRCPELVEIIGTPAGFAAVEIRQGATGAEVRDLAVRGPAIGVALSGSENVVVDRVWSHDLGSAGFVVDDYFGATSGELTRSLVESSRYIGVFVNGATAKVEATVVRDTKPQTSDQQFGRGISIQNKPDARASATVHGSLIDGNRDVGVFVIGSDATIEATVVRGTQPRAFDDLYGRGIGIEVDPATGERANAAVRGSLVAGNHEVGVYVGGADAMIETTVVRDTQPQASDQLFGMGVGVRFDSSQRGAATVRASMIENNMLGGVAIRGSDATIEASVVRGTLPQAIDQQFGRGINVEMSPDTGDRSTAAVRASVIEGNRDVGVGVNGSDATIDATVVLGTLPQASDGRFGDGVAIDALWSTGATATLQLTACVVAGSARAGVASFGAPVGIAHTSLDCNGFHLAGENYDPAASFAFDDRGGNACACGEATVACQVESPGLEAPPPLE